MAKEINSRVACFLILEQVLERNSPLDSALDHILNRFSDQLEAQDRGFIRHLTTTCLRRLGQLDKIINLCTERKLGAQQYKQRLVLRIGITQLLFMEVADHAAVSMSVGIFDYFNNTKLSKFKGMVNAILRRVSREKSEFVKKSGNTRLNMPQWLLRNWDENYGQKNVKEMLDIFLQEPPLDIMLSAGEEPSEWIARFGETGIVTSLLPTGGLRLIKAGPIPQLPGYEEGKWWVQDMAATIPAQLLGAKAGDKVLDLCAAPGGKAAQSAAKGCIVTAVDLSERRLERLFYNMERLNLEVLIHHSDVGTYEPDDDIPFILLDAPCTSSGTLRRHPEMAWTRDEYDVSDLSKIQEKLLNHTFKNMPVGGTLVYCVCSVEKPEGVDQIKKFLKKHKNAARTKITADEVFGLENIINDEGDILTLPHYYSGGMDGFFISRLTKVSAD